MCGSELGRGPKLDSLRHFVKQKWKRESQREMRVVVTRRLPSEVPLAR